MKSHSFQSVFVGGLMVAFIAAISSLQSVQAQTCYNQQQQPIPCPKPNYKNPTQPVYPTKTSTPTDTPAPQPVGANTSPTTNTIACSNNLPSGPGQNPGTGQASSGGNTWFPWLLGGGGLFIGILIGLFIPFRAGSFFDLKPGGISQIRESPLNPGGGLKVGSFFDETVGKGTPGGGDIDAINPKIGPKHDDPAPPPPPESASFFDDSTGPISSKIGPKHDDPSPPPPDGDIANPDRLSHLDGGDTSLDLDTDLDLNHPQD